MSSDDPALRYAVLDYVPLGVLVLDREMRVRFWNACLEDWTEIPRAQIIGVDVRERFPHFAEARYAGRIQALFAGGAPTVFSSQLHPHVVPSRLRSGRLRVQQTMAVAVPAREGEVGGAFEALLAIQDVTNLADAMEALRGARDEAKHQAATDSLTGISNRRHFVEAAERLLAQALRYGRPCALVLIDVDRFKGINDTHGHATGDTVLRTIVAVLGRTLRESDLIGRLGGDEFAALLPETSAAMGLVTGERLRAAVQGERLTGDARDITLSVSVGVAALDETARTLDAVFKKADAALYEAKKRGRNRVVAA
jgi:diguanylate cyclase (GGDEF)-like protein